MAGIEFQELLRANNLAKAAYAEVLNLAFGKWIADHQVDESLLHKLCHVPRGKRQALSLGRIDFPFSLNEIRSVLFDPVLI